jgi:hypothetical protein
MRKRTQAFSAYFLNQDSENQCITGLPPQKTTPLKRTQIRPGKEEVRMKNEEKSQFLAIINAH